MDAEIRRTDPTADKHRLSQIEMLGGQVYKRYLEENSGLG
jgi:hypothetical protein